MYKRFEFTLTDGSIFCANGRDLDDATWALREFLFYEFGDTAAAIAYAAEVEL